MLEIVAQCGEVVGMDAALVGVTLMGVAPYQLVATMPESMPAA